AFWLILKDGRRFRAVSDQVWITPGSRVIHEAETGIVTVVEANDLLGLMAEPGTIDSAQLGEMGRQLVTAALFEARFSEFDIEMRGGHRVRIDQSSRVAVGPMIQVRN